jgi:hypothetical protein
LRHTATHDDTKVPPFASLSDTQLLRSETHVGHGRRPELHACLRSSGSKFILADRDHKLVPTDEAGQKKARELAGQKVKVIGRVSGKTIRVTRLRPPLNVATKRVLGSYCLVCVTDSVSEVQASPFLFVLADL